jgi:hypothetical protein
MQYTFNPFTDKLDAVGTSGMGPGSLDTLSGNDGVIVSPVGNNISLYGIGGNYLFAAGAGTIHVNNLYWLSQYVVDPNPTPGLNASYQTIQAAITAAAASGSGGTVMIRKGTYTENITLAPNVNLVGFSGLSLSPNTIIHGTVTANFSGSCTLTNIAIQENSGSPFQMAGSSNMFIFAENIDISSTNTDNIIGSNASAQLIMFNSIVTQNAAHGFFSLTGGGISSFNTFWNDQNGLATQSSLSASNFAINGGQNFAGLILSNGSSAQLRNTAVTSNAGPAFTINDTSSINLLFAPTQAMDGTSEAIATTSASASANISFCQLNSGATYAITGAGSIQYDHLSFQGTDLLDPALSLNVLSTLPLSKAAASPGTGFAGHCYFNSADFSVDSTGFVSATGGSSIQTIDGDTGSITGTTVTIFADQAGINCGTTVEFVNSGTTSTLNLTDGVGNTMLGKGSGSLAYLGPGQNVGLGTGCLSNLISGNRTLAVGYQAGTSYLSGESNNILIQNSGTPLESNTLRIGTQGSGVGQVNTCYIAGITGVTVSTPSAVVINPSTGQLGVGASSPTGLNWNITTANVSPMSTNNGYICVGPGGALTLLLPPVSVLGDEIIVTLDGAASFQITQGAGQSIRLANTSTTAGVTGSITSTQQGDTITMVCQLANLKWNVISSIGNLTVA